MADQIDLQEMTDPMPDLAQLQATSMVFPVGTVIAEAPSGRILHANAAAREVLGGDLAVLGDAQAWFHGDGRPVRAAEFPLARILAGADITGASLRLNRPDGSVGWIRVRASPVHDAAGAVTHAIVTLDDLADGGHVAERRAESALRQTMRLEAIGQLTGGVAHEFNNLLTAVLGSLDLLRRRMSDERQLRWVEAATSAAHRGAVLTGQLLSYARKQFLAPAATDIPASLGGMMELIRGSLGSPITLETAFATGTWPALADPAQLELALLNLLVNARDAMSGAGRVTLSTANYEATHADLPPELEPGDYVLLAVADTGIGMSPDILARAMEPFFTTKEFGGGSGLGLSQAYGMARQLGGTIRLRSVPGQGATVHMFLPRAESPAPPQARPVLLVDDDEDVRSIAAALLREEGWEVQEAANGVDALAALAIAPAAVLLADLAMPGMSGIELAEAARARQPGLPVVFLTGNPDLDVLRTLPGPVLEKPYSVDALLNAVRDAVADSA